MDRFFNLYYKAVRLFALASLSFALLYFIIWLFILCGVPGVLSGIILGEEQKKTGEGDLFHVYDSSVPPEPSEEKPSVLL